ncbi:hypothetical protein CHELA40_14170 [Chelatococcus asaccharovorans]|nr:hypothetical protein CHELA17_61451 [Chelatococcus asaccharovorans]CAH1675660.1 hypothetical protein CHELA40_14170 [Chelatococcus asaccharovorans]
MAPSYLEVGASGKPGAVQFRYVFFLHRGARRHLRLKVQPYPKPDEFAVDQ